MRGRAWIAALLALMMAFSLAAQAQSNGESPVLGPNETGEDLLFRAQNLYEYGDYVGMVHLLEAGLVAERFTNAELPTVHRLLGSGHLILQDEPKAAEHFLRLLTRDPDTRLDPLYTPPDIIAFFERVREENREMLAAILEQRREDEEARREIEAPPPSTVRLRHNPYFVNFLPFGAGQYQNNQPVKGTLFLSAELIALGLNVAGYFVSDSLKGSDSYYTAGAAREARNWRIVQYASLGALVALLIGGTVDAALNYQPVTPLDAGDGNEMEPGEPPSGEQP